jgi:phosphatidylglycerophosphatase A
LVVFAGGRICEDAEQIFGVKDAHRIVWDEMCGFLVTMYLVPEGWRYVVIGFVLFRIFDTFKLPFIKWVQSLPGGWGVMGDDILAGILSNIILRIISIYL